jgi:hypothetical protein
LVSGAGWLGYPYPASFLAFKIGRSLALNRGPRAKVTDFRYGFRKIKALKLVSVGAGNYF